MRAGLIRLWRMCVGLALVAAMCVGIGARPAAAFASTGTITVEGSYSYWYDDDPTYPDASLTMSSWACTDTWAGTTSTAAGGGATCGFWMSGGTYWWGERVGYRFEAGYSASGGAWSQSFMMYGGPATMAGAVTATGTATFSPYEGPAVATLTLTPTWFCIPSTWTTCGPWGTDCVPSCGPLGSWAYGEFTLTLDYALH